MTKHAPFLILAIFSLISINAHAIVVSPGDIIVTEFFEDLFHIDPVSGEKTRIATAADLTFSEYAVMDDNFMLFTNDNNDRILRIDPSTGTSSIVVESDKLSGLTGLALGPSGSLVAAVRDSVIRIDAATGSIQTVSEPGGFFSPRGIATSGAGDIYVTEFFNDLIQIDPVTGDQRINHRLLPSVSLDGRSAGVPNG